MLAKLIGSGGFRKVYRASVQSNGSTIAVEFFRKAVWQNEEARESFIREIGAASRIRHASATLYLGYNECPHGGRYVLSEWIDGRPMHVIDRPSEQRFTKWLRQICDAIQAVHNAGWVHGDLTIANALIDNHDRVTITDFGFSQACVGATSPIFGGIPGFAAPEQIDPAFGNISAKTDIYAIGGLIHWNLYGTPPNAGDGATQIMMPTIDRPHSREDTEVQTDMILKSITQRLLHPSPVSQADSIEAIVALLDRLPERKIHASGQDHPS